MSIIEEDDFWKDAINDNENKSTENSRNKPIKKIKLSNNKYFHLLKTFNNNNYTNKFFSIKNYNNNIKKKIKTQIKNSILSQKETIIIIIIIILKNSNLKII